MLMRRKILVVSLPFLLFIFQNISLAQKVEMGFSGKEVACDFDTSMLVQKIEVGFRFGPGILFTKSHYADDNAPFGGLSPIVLHVLLNMQVYKYVMLELRGGIAGLSSFSGSELGLLVKSYLLKQTLYGIACGWLHWNIAGGHTSIGLQSRIYEKLFPVIGFGVGVQISKRTSLEILFLKPFGDLGYTEQSYPRIKRPIESVGLLRLGFGVAWEL